MSIALEPIQIASFEELLISQVVSQEALISILVEKAIFAKDEFWQCRCA